MFFQTPILNAKSAGLLIKRALFRGLISKLRQYMATTVSNTVSTASEPVIQKVRTDIIFPIMTGVGGMTIGGAAGYAYGRWSTPTLPPIDIKVIPPEFLMAIPGGVTGAALGAGLAAMYAPKKQKHPWTLIGLGAGAGLGGTLGYLAGSYLYDDGRGASAS